MTFTIEQEGDHYYANSGSERKHIPTKQDGVSLITNALLSGITTPGELLIAFKKLFSFENLPDCQSDYKYKKESIQGTCRLLEHLEKARIDKKPFAFLCDCGEHVYMGGKDFYVKDRLTNKPECFIATLTLVVDGFISEDEGLELELILVNIKFSNPITRFAPLMKMVQPHNILSPDIAKLSYR